MSTIVIADAIHPIAKSLLKNANFEVVDVSSNKDLLFNSLSNASALIVRSATKVTQDLLSQAPELKIIGRAGVGLDNVDLAACQERNIEVVNSPDGPTNSVAELALALIIIVSRKLGINFLGTREGKWPKQIKGNEINGKILGIIGSGAIGGTLAKACIGLGMNIYAFDIVINPELEKMEGFTYTDLDSLLELADIISLHLPLVPATRHLIDEQAFQKMKDGVIIVNTSRGGIIDENALLQALSSGKVLGAGLDVFEKEPLTSTNPLISQSNVFVTSHIGAQTYEAGKNNSEVVCKKIIEFLK
ncbi:MAG: hydroxyacid dehydrogenase [Candidatus Kariarchaeaceae archaeon]|jgi:D-3-phosphoglycerate dehydrogenase